MIKSTISSAIEDFHRARRQAKIENILARLTGRSTELLSYDEVRQKLKAREGINERLEDIPLDAIVGSVGRYQDFSRSFLPKQDSTAGRWAKVEMAMTSMAGVPPIEVYKIGDAYFVRDGNHRVSVARQLGATHIHAYVTEVNTRVPLSPDIQPDDLILKAEYAEFLEHTGIDEHRPEADLSVTAPGKYQALEEHIQVHRYFMGREQQREIPYEEAVTHWYDEVYLPVVRLIRERGILRDFPERTETDLYLWIAEHRAALEKELGWEISSDKAAADLTAQFSSTPGHVAARVGGRLLDALTPDELESGPPPGQWRQERLTANQANHVDCLFSDILVAISGEESGWCALDQALVLAQCEKTQLHGLHVVASEAERESDDVAAIRAEFDRRCEAAGVSGRIVIKVGTVHRQVCEQARWADLVILSLKHPPDTKALANLGSGLTTIIRRCPRPVLTTAGAPSPLNRPLLAYDGSPKAEEALFVTTYLAQRREVSPVVVSVKENGRTTARTLEQAREYLEAHGVEATFVHQAGAVADAIMDTANAHDCDLIVMGGYGRGPVLEVVLGSALDQVLRQSHRPTLICR